MFDLYGVSGPPTFPEVSVGRIVGLEFISINQVPVSPVPENETYAMLLVGLGLLGFIGRRKQKGNQIEKI